MRSSSLLTPVTPPRRTLKLAVLACAVTGALGLAGLAGCPSDSPPLTLGLNAEQHAAYFPIDALAPHALNAASPDGVPLNCDSCHAGRETFKEALCFSCHQLDATPLSTAHSRVAGYEPIDASCFSCHPSGDSGTVDGAGTHSDLWFPIDPDDAHGNAEFLARVGTRGDSCAACHASTEDRSLPLCVDCHSRNDPVPLGIAHESLATSYVQTDIACKECHADIPINPNVRPVSVHDDAIFLTSHHEATCANCHFTYRSEPQEWAIEFAVASCIQCHVDACTPDSQAACFP